MYGCESWTVNKAKCRRIEAFELQCWRRLLRVPWAARRSNQSIVKEISPEYSLEGLMLKLKPTLWPPHAKNWLTGKDPDAGKDWRQEEKGTPEDEMVGWHHRLDEHEFWASSGSWWRTGRPGVRQSMGLQSQTQLSNWTDEATKWSEITYINKWWVAGLNLNPGLIVKTIHCQGYPTASCF